MAKAPRAPTIFRWLMCGLLLVGSTSCTLSSSTRARIDEVDPPRDHASDIWCSWVARYSPVFDADPLFLLEKDSGKNSELSLTFTQPNNTVERVVLREVALTPSRRGAKSVSLLQAPITIRLVPRDVGTHVPRSMRKAMERPSERLEFSVHLKPRPYPYTLRVAGDWVSKNGTHQSFDRPYTIKMSWRMALLRGVDSQTPSYKRPRAKRPKHKMSSFG
jgi:hypothetical protein